MTTRTLITTLVAVLSTAPLTLGLPKRTNAVPNNLGEDYIVETVGVCTATYKYDLGNTLPAFEQCYSAFAYINDAGKPGPDGCGGTFGGALGWDNKGNRTRDPIYALYPSSGSGNCFKQPGQEKDAPLPRDMLPDGSKLPIEQCPSAVSRRDIGGTTGCTIASSFYGFSCSAVCLAWVASLTAWWTFGAGVAAGILPCLGGCTGASLGFDAACEKLAKHDKLKPRLLLDAAPPAGPCEGTQSVAIECPAIRTSLLAFHKCPGSEPDKPEEVATGEDGGGINF
ncbi:MAG: hypothetical protein L6R36_004790 [Xanthoria steineri]|nr:MAG: hypothetical protein L6R36_004790 [Xanthoria steineri]